MPVRSHSMSLADVNSRHYGSPPLPRFRPPPPPGHPGAHHSRDPRATREQREDGAGVEITELGDSGSENEDHDNGGHRPKHQRPKKHFIHHNNQVVVENIGVGAAGGDGDYNRKYKTLDPNNRVRSHEAGNFNSLDRGTRRKLPSVPTGNNGHHSISNSHSLPRPPKHHGRDQSDSRSRER